MGGGVRAVCGNGEGVRGWVIALCGWVGVGGCVFVWVGVCGGGGGGGVGGGGGGCGKMNLCVSV